MDYLSCGLALGGGGLKLATHIGVLQVFQEEGFPIEMISGTSAGAVVASMYAVGYSALEMKNLLEEFVRNPVDFRIRPWQTLRIVIKSLLNLLNLGKYNTDLGLIRGNQLEDYLRKLMGNHRFDGLVCPVMITATDLLSGRLQVFTDSVTGRRLRGIHDIDIITDSDLVTAVRASTAIPGFFTPVHYQGKVLVDGGVLDVVPADLLRYAGVKRIVGIDLFSQKQKDEALDDLFDIVVRTIDFMGKENTDLVLERFADFIVHPKLEAVSLTDYKKMLALYEEGYRETRKKCSALKSLLAGNQRLKERSNPVRSW